MKKFANNWNFQSNKKEHVYRWPLNYITYYKIQKNKLIMRPKKKVIPKKLLLQRHIFKLLYFKTLIYSTHF
jgi:hypothetical protein